MTARAGFGAILVAAGMLIGGGCEVADPSASQRVTGPPAPMVRSIDDIRYGLSEWQHLDLYQPPRPNGGVIVWVHGGAWADSGGNGDTFATEEPPGMQPVVLALYALGWTVASVGYTDVFEAPLPQQELDVKLAIRWVRRHAREFDVDPSSVVAMGWSAGGHLAALAGTSSGSLEPTEVPADLQGISSRPDAVVSIQGVLDPSRFGETPGVFESNPAAMAAAMGCPGRPAEWLSCDPVRLASVVPANHLDPSDPPIYIVAGDHDGIVALRSQALDPYRRFVEVLGEGRVLLDVVDTGSPQDHGGVDPRNHSLAVSYELNATVLFGFLETFLPASAPSAPHGGAVHLL